MNIQAALSRFLQPPLADASCQLLNELGYKSDRTVDLPSSKPEDFHSIVTQMVPGATFDRTKALFDDWSSANLLFQLTDEDLSGQNTLFKETAVAPGLLRSYLFFAVELTGADYSRTKLTGIVRQLNRLFPMPVMVFIKHREKDKPVLSIAVINRAQNKREASKDVLGKVTIIRGIALENTHRGHLDILDSLRVENLKHPHRLPINNFDALHAAWEEIFNVELLNKRFYQELSNWFFWALPQVDFPADVDPDSERRRATSLIRLLTRLIFCWFLKEKHLIPEDVFVEAELRKILRELDDESSSFHEAVLQNLFFATLNRPINQRGWAEDKGFHENKHDHGVTLYRYEGHFQEGRHEAFQAKLSEVPFLNGGLFECLDQEKSEDRPKLYVDGFSRNAKKRPVLPNRLFFSPEHKVDLSDAYGEPKRKNETVRGLIRLLNSYKFTIVENTPLDQEVALDPELLGKVFENLLASYNSETKTTARKQTGSFYTPRPIVDYIVDESLKSYLSQVLVQHGSSQDRAKVGLTSLLGYGEESHPFTSKEQDLLLEAIHQCKILDPACGSGAFPMGMLHKLVHVIHKLDPSNSWWKQKHLDVAEQNLDSVVREAAVKQVLEIFEENDPDYGRKLYLIENCLYGADIQPIAIQISKLRFFISLICDQREAPHKENRGIRPLPNLETKFVAANTLLALDTPPQRSLVDPEIEEIERAIGRLYHDHFGARSRPEKLKIQKRVKELRKRLAALLEASIGQEAKQIADWDAFDQQQPATFFDPHWMFGQSLTEGFDIVFGNPPYLQIQKLPNDVKEQLKPFPVKKGKGKAEVRPRFDTFDSMGDIYCLFYERGAQLLKPEGTLSYITSNKWMRTGYGESLRRYLAEKVNTLAVLDFGMAQNFGAATTYTCITTLVKQGSDRKIESCYAGDDRAAMADPASYFEANKVELAVDASPWVILSPERQRIKQMVEAQGVPLEKWDINIYRGVLTGFNEAFYVTSEQKEAFCSEDPRCEEVLVPLLTGADIKRYGAEWDGTWMINSHNGVKATGLPRVDLERDYPVLWRHISQPKFRDTLVKRADQGDHWSNLRNCAYVAEFAKPKIIYQEIAVALPFFFDNKGSMFMDTTCFMITSSTEPLPYLTSIFNSTLFRCCFRGNFPEYSGNACRVKKIFVDKIPIRKPQEGDSALFEPLVNLIQFARRTLDNGGAGDEMRATFLEDLIDACVMECYFRDHMAERDLLFHDQLRPLLAGFYANAGRDAQLEFLHQFYETVNAPAHPVRNQLIRLTADSPDLLAVIKREGAV
jgi:type I restriction-modification system DNA methylase subunit